MKTVPALLCASLVLAQASCLPHPAGKCGVFLGADPSGCFREFEYASVVQIESGRVRRGVYRCFNSGTGVLIDPSGILVTAAHVVNGRSPVATFLEAEDKAYGAEPLPGLTDQDRDLSFLRITRRGERVAGGCVLAEQVSRTRFPAAPVAPASWRKAHGSDVVQVIGYPDDRPLILRGRLINPENRMVQFAAQDGLSPSVLADFLESPDEPALFQSASGGEKLRLDGLRTLARRRRQGCLFVELDATGRHPGISGGAIVYEGELVGIPIESWNSFEKTILIGVPVTRESVREALRRVLPSSP